MMNSVFHTYLKIAGIWESELENILMNNLQ
jgi:hypothetical protein